MTPKEKAIELVEKMSKQTYSFQAYAGAHLSTEEIGLEAGYKCALIAVTEMEDSLKSFPDSISCHMLPFWKKVKEEIEKL